MSIENSYLLIGLGNPGREYRNSRHNIGFRLIDRLCVRLNAGGMKLQSKSLVIKTEVEGRRLFLAKPQTYMNLSGGAVQGLLHFYKIPFEHLLVAHDDLDLPFGSLRIRPGGGPGGQRGMVSTIERLGTRDFPRLRMGIGRPPGRMDPKDYVLQDFSREQEEFLPVILDHAGEAALEFVLNGLNAAMNKHNKDYSQDSE
ncbi:MAG: aminoacyl-tRNA hydrolase [Chloroflexi bacterium]|nr:aminoacyl-tRNA hydrolase [Chloroflexota bacterium]